MLYRDVPKLIIAMQSGLVEASARFLRQLLGTLPKAQRAALLQPLCI
jgi:hypothetical protein